MCEPPLPEGVPERLARIVASAAILEGDVVLDVGTGTGILVPLIRPYRPAQIYGCDLSSKMLAKLRKNYPGVKTLLSDVRHLTLARADRRGRPRRPEATGGPRLGEVDATEVVLFESRLRPQGARYTALEAFPLSVAPSQLPPEHRRDRP